MCIKAVDSACQSRTCEDELVSYCSAPAGAHAYFQLLREAALLAVAVLLGINTAVHGYAKLCFGAAAVANCTLQSTALVSACRRCYARAITGSQSMVARNGKSLRQRADAGVPAASLRAMAAAAWPCQRQHAISVANRRTSALICSIRQFRNEDEDKANISMYLAAGYDESSLHI